MSGRSRYIGGVFFFFVMVYRFLFGTCGVILEVRRTVMRQRSEDWMVAALAAVGGVTLAVIASYFGGFLGIGLAGLLIGFAAVQYDLKKQDVGGGFPSPSLYARQVAVREQMAPDERLAHSAGIRALWRPLVIAKTLSVGLVALGFGGYFFL